MNTTQILIEHPVVEVACPVCGADKPKPLFWTKDYVFNCTPLWFRLNRCTSCGCGYLSPRPARKDMGRYYPLEFYWSWEGEADSLAWESIIYKRRHQLNEKSKWLIDLPAGRMLDIGAQKGEFLWFMRQRGWVVEGVELDSSVPNPAGMPIQYGDFLEMPIEEARYDVITFWAVLEHVYEPALFVQKASRLLKPGGRLVALVTNFRSIQARFYQADDYPRHLTLFNKPSIERLCTDSDLTLTRVATGQDIFGGSLGGGLLYLWKRMLGYSATEVLAEWKQLRDPNLFWCKWRGEKSFMVRAVSRLDRVMTLPIEIMLDRLGFGFILTFSAEKTVELGDQGWCVRNNRKA